MRIYAHGNAVVVREEDQVGGRKRSDDHRFRHSGGADVAQIACDNAGGGKLPEELNWMNNIGFLEEIDPRQAPDAYRQAVRLDPENADAHVNLAVSISWRGIYAWRAIIINVRDCAQ